MFQVTKNKGKRLKAYRLGDENPALARLMAEGKIVPLEDGLFEVFSQEVLKSGAEHGELAATGDYVKIDSTGEPYPNSAAFFEANHVHVSGDVYEQIPQTFLAWSAEEPMCEEIRFLIREKGLVLDPEHPERFFTAPLWGTTEAGDIHAILVFYFISYREDGTVEDASYNLVERSEFEKTYSRCES